MSVSFAARLLAWYDLHGRHDLPWQQGRNLYRVWVAEIMLQQTQVTTVIPYYKNFLQKFPNLKQLALADQDQVLQAWAGLGYYSRARNLHRAAQTVQQEHAGRMPRDIDGLLALPGIGRSTAAAILSQVLDQRHAILDGNVKRVLARYHAVDGWPGQSAVADSLWQLAEQHTPHERNADYTQAIMDLGATLCTRSKPACERCPLQADCRAHAQENETAYPGKKPRRSLPVKTTRFLLLLNSDGHILLEKRPPSGIWGGLWSLPETELEDDTDEVCASRWGLALASSSDLPGFRHTFSHYHLDIQPVKCVLEDRADAVRDTNEITWHRPGDTLPAVAAPVAKLLAEIEPTD